MPASQTSRIPLDPIKVGAIELAHRRFGLRSFADLGAVWAVNAGYSLHAAGLAGVKAVTVVDEDFTAAATAAIDSRRNVRALRGNFGDPQIAERVGQVDAVLLFDVLLHQVKPDWDEILALYAPHTSVFVLAGPWYRAEGPSVRLLELGEQKYLETVIDQELNHGLFDRLDELNPARGRPWRDVHDIWQWGITDQDLRAQMRRHGFELGYYENHGSWRGLPAFTSAAYVFTRGELLER